MKKYLNNLSHTQTNIITWIIFILIFMLSWFPLKNTNKNLREKNRRAYESFQWVQEVDKKIAVSQKTSHALTPNLTTIITQQIKKNAVAKLISEYHPQSQNNVELVFRQVSFDQLMQWIILLWQQYNIKVIYFSAAPIGSQGMVTASLSLNL